MKKKVKLLAVDDEIDFLQSISRRLEMRGFEVDLAQSGNEALELMEKRLYDIALLDLKMPGIDGIEVLKELKDKHKYIEVIILTAHGTNQSAFESSKLGAYGFLTKPFNFDELILTIRKAYEARLKNKFSDDEEKINKLYELAGQLPFGAEDSLEFIEKLKEMDDDKK